MDYLPEGSLQMRKAIQARPAAMLHRPKKRIWPSLSLRICSNMPRQPRGENKGSRPSITSIKASACQIVLLSKRRRYFLLAGAEPLPELRMALKKSEDGSITITSPFLSKLAL